jgi:hypothetical protein
MNVFAAVTWADPPLDAVDCAVDDPEAATEELLLLEQAATAMDMIATNPSMAGVVRLRRRTVI